MRTLDIGVFSDAINQKLDRDLNNLDIANTDIIIGHQDPTEANGYTWYRLYKSGWVEQGGYVVSNGNTDQHIVLLMEMNNDTYYVSTKSKSSVTTRPNDTNAANRNTAFFFNKVIYNQTTTGFNIGSTTEMSIVGTYWRVEGMAA